MDHLKQAVSWIRSASTEAAAAAGEAQQHLYSLYGLYAEICNVEEFIVMCIVSHAVIPGMPVISSIGQLHWLCEIICLSASLSKSL
jgi:hypothetical protein